MAGVPAAIAAPLAGETAAMVQRLCRSLVLVRSGYGHGSGVIWESEGLIITNHYVVTRDHAEVELTDGRRLAATVEARDPENDLAALRVEAWDLPAAPVGESTALRVGELIVAVGHPFGVRGTATLGIVSGMGGVVRGAGLPHGVADRMVGAAGRARRELLPVDLDLAPGNSGGPLANPAGEVVGIASMIVSPGVALAIPSHVVGRFVAGLQRPVDAYPNARLRPSPAG